MSQPPADHHPTSEREQCTHVCPVEWEHEEAHWCQLKARHDGPHVHFCETQASTVIPTSERDGSEDERESEHQHVPADFNFPADSAPDTTLEEIEARWASQYSAPATTPVKDTLDLMFRDIRTLLDTVRARDREIERLRQLITDSHLPHGRCYWGLGYLYDPDKGEACTACAAKRQMKSIANGMDGAELEQLKGTK